MENNNSGETSKKKGSDVNESDRPLKKARYLWQVKGKYHLKENVQMLNSDSVESPDIHDEMQNEHNKHNNENSENELMSCNNNIAQTRNKNACNDRSCIEALIANSDKIMVMDFPEPESPPKNIDKAILDEIPITLVKPSPKNEDYYLRKWQARQIAKGFVDNTINRVLESWMVAPFDAADFVENCDNGGQAEDEGILMAIQSHGLQSGTTQRNHDILLQSSSRSSHCRPTDALNTSCTCSKTHSEANMNSIKPFHRREDNDFSIEYYENLCVLKDSEPVQNFMVLEKPPPTSNIEDNIEIPSEENNDISYEALKMNDTDFLDAAVTAAIQKKGLTSYNCVDCG